MIVMQIGVSFTRSLKVTEYDVVCGANGMCRVDLQWLEKWLFADTVTDGYVEETDYNRIEPDGTSTSVGVTCRS